MEEVSYLKNDTTVGSGSYAFKAVSDEKVFRTVRASLITNGLIIIPIEQVHQHTDTLSANKDGVPKMSRFSTVDTKYRIFNIEDGEYIDAVSSGTGEDSSDKGVGKAQTYSYKYLLLRIFTIPVGDKPDEFDTPAMTPGKKVIVVPQVQNSPTPEQTEGKPDLTTKQLNQAIARIEKGEFALVEVLEQNFTVTPGQKEHMEQSINYAKRQLAERELVNA